MNDQMYIPIQRIAPAGADWADIAITYRDEKEPNASFSIGEEDPKVVERRFARVKQLLKTDTIVMPRPVHGSAIYISNPIPDKLQSPFNDNRDSADTIHIEKTNVWGAFAPADCAIVIVMNPHSHTIGLLHLGWRGIVKQNLQTYFRHFTTNPEQCHVYVAPFASSGFRLRPEEIPELQELNRAMFDSYVVDGDRFDIKKALDEQLLQAKVSPSNIEFHPDNTLEGDKYFSYNKSDKSETRRFLVAAKIIN